MLGQVVGMAEDDPAMSKAVLESAEKTDGRERPVGAKNKRKKTQAWQEKSTRRDPSGFEYEITRSTRTKHKCTNCRKPGHYKKRCPDLRNQSTEDQRDQDSGSWGNEASEADELEDQALLVVQLDRERRSVTWDDGSLEYFQSHDFGIGDLTNRELTIEELEALVPEK